MKSGREYQVFAKPGGAACNLECRYCYYLEKQALYPGVRTSRMAETLLEEYITQQIDLSSGDVVRFSWHGGEPTLLGLDYYRRIVELQKKHLPSFKRAANALVTNGTLLNGEWCEFLSGEAFAVGLSVDGPTELHDAYRVARNGRPTHRRVMDVYGLLMKHSVPCDILCVVHDQNVRAPLRVYEFFKEIGAAYVGFLPLVRHGDGDSREAGEWSVRARDYGSFLSTIFDEWVRHDIGRILIQNFDEAARPVRGLEHALCVFRETCGDVPVLEHNGDVYSCDHFVDSAHHLGNIEDRGLVDLLCSSAQRQFGNAKRDSLPRYCVECDVLEMCNGGCPKDRFIEAPDGEPGLNYLCAGFKEFFQFCRPTFERLVPLWKNGAKAKQLMAAARGESEIVGLPGRNHPCPCGSGLKFKKCCMKEQTIR